jgi:glycolate oxidase iron-sulfur subunit
VSADTITALNKNDVSVFVPSSQSCCGLPHISGGDIDSFKELAINNAMAFKDKGLEYIITSCASCSYSISKLYPLYFNEENQSYNNDLNYKEVVDFSKKLIDIWTFFNILRKKGGQIKKGKLQQEISAAFHIPCHLKNADDFKASSKNEKLIGEAGLIIDNIEGLELKPLKHNYCCGNGGMFNVRHYEMSKEITRKKFEEIKEATPQTVVTSCSGCMFSLKDQKGIMKKSEEIPVKHLIELYAKSLLKEQNLL